MTAKIPGELVINPYLNCKMHKVREYQKDGYTRALYSDFLPKFVRHLKRRLKNHRQNIIVIDGGTGSGKSTLMITAALMQDPALKLDDAYIYYRSDMARRLRDLLNGDASTKFNLIDEGSVLLNSLNARKTEDNDTIVLFDILRSWGMTTYICIPDKTDLNKKLMAHLVDYWISCPDDPLVPGYDSRGFYEVFKPSRGQFSKDVWWDCIGAGVYGPLPKDIDKSYQAIKSEHQSVQAHKYISKYLEA